MELLLASAHQVDAGDMRVHTARQIETLRHGGELAVVQDVPLGDMAGAADLTLAVGVGQEQVQRLDPLRQPGLEILPLLVRQHARHDVERDRGLAAGGGAIGTESDPLAPIEAVDLGALAVEHGCRRLLQPARDLTIRRTHAIGA